MSFIWLGEKVSLKYLLIGGLDVCPPHARMVSASLMPRLDKSSNSASRFQNFLSPEWHVCPFLTFSQILDYSSCPKIWRILFWAKTRKNWNFFWQCRWRFKVSKIANKYYHGKKIEFVDDFTLSCLNLMTKINFKWIFECNFKKIGRESGLPNERDDSQPKPDRTDNLNPKIWSPKIRVARSGSRWPGTNAQSWI